MPIEGITYVLTNCVFLFTVSFIVLSYTLNLVKKGDLLLGINITLVGGITFLLLVLINYYLYFFI